MTHVIQEYLLKIPAVPGPDAVLTLRMQPGRIVRAYKHTFDYIKIAVVCQEPLCLAPGERRFVLLASNEPIEDTVDALFHYVDHIESLYLFEKITRPSLS